MECFEIIVYNADNISKYVMAGLVTVPECFSGTSLKKISFTTNNAMYGKHFPTGYAVS